MGKVAFESSLKEWNGFWPLEIGESKVQERKYHKQRHRVLQEQSC